MKVTVKIASIWSIGSARARVSLLCVFFAWLWLFSSPVTLAAERQHIVVLGDSLSAGYGIESENGWVALLQQRLDEHFAGQFEVINSSVSGDTTANGVARLPRLLNQYQPAVLIVELGGNDGLRGLSLKVLRKNLERMIDAATAADTATVIIGMQIPTNYGAAYARGFSRSFEQAAKAGNATLVPFFLDGFETDLSFFLADRIHPNENGQPLMLDNVWPALEPLLLQ